MPSHDAFLFHDPSVALTRTDSQEQSRGLRLFTPRPRRWAQPQNLADFSDLLRELFTTRELTVVLYSLPQGPRIVRLLNDACGTCDRFVATPHVLQHEGMLDHAMFDLLVALRPAERARVEQARQSVLGVASSSDA